MEIAFLSASMLDRSWEAALDAAALHHIRLIEPCAGGHIPKTHYDPARLVADQSALEDFKRTLADRGQEICAFSCHGNPLHPRRSIAEASHNDFVATCELAQKMGVQHIKVLAGTPAGGPNDETPNWIINSAWAMFKEAYKWQWQERVIPYWTEAAKVADRFGVKICVEPHTGDVVYNTQTFLRLRAAVGPTIGMNIDPSHLWWQGIDPIVLIQTLGSAIYSCHVKDVYLDPRLVARDGVASSADYDDWEARSWSYRTIGFGHSEAFWRDFIIALRRIGYDGALSIECEEPYLTLDDSLCKSVQLLRYVMPEQGPPTKNWMEDYQLDNYDERLSSTGPASQSAT